MRYILLFLAVIIPNIVYGATYTNTLLKDIVTTDPAENCLPSEYNDAERETRLVMTYIMGMGSSTASKTLTGTQTFHLGSSTTTITLPAASTIASAKVGKEFLLHNTGAGTITVSVPTLNNAAGTITLSANQSAYLFSDNVSYYELRNSTEYNHIADSTDPHGATLTQTNFIATTGTITTFTATTANISSTLTVNGVTGIVDGDIPNTITLDNITQITSRAHDSITGTGTYSHTSIDSHIDDTSDPHGASLTQTNISVTTGTVTTLYNTTFSGNVGTFTGTLGVNGISGIVDNDIPGTITLDAITQITSRAHDDITGTGTNSHATIDTHLADTSDPHGASLTQTNIDVTTGTVTTLYNTTFSGGAGTFTGTLGVNGISGVVDSDIPNDITVTKAVTSWASGGTTGTGTMNLAAGSGMSLTPTYNSNGIGTITFTAAGTASAGGWTVGGTQTVTESSAKFGGVLNLNSNWISGDDDAEGIYILASGLVGIGTNTPANALHVVGSITVSGNVDGRDISADGTTLDSHTADTTDPHGASLTQTNISVTTGTVTTLYGTTIAIGGTATADSFVGDGSQLTGLANSWDNLTGIPTNNGSVTVNSTASTIPFRDASQNLFATGIVGGTTTGALRIPSGTTAQRPGTPAIGMMRIASPGTFYAASGGTITTAGAYTIHTFHTSSDFSPGGTTTEYGVEFYTGTKWTAIGSIGGGLAIDYLVVAGGGGGGDDTGGGGAGGLLYGSSTVRLGETIPLVIGAGGAVDTAGNASYFGTIIATGGGRGGNNVVPGGNGGSGGGGGYDAGLAGGTGIAGQGMNGGAGQSGSPYDCGGGGGAGQAGYAYNAGSPNDGEGGDGLQYSISGTPIYYAGGGAGLRGDGEGGLGGGGNTGVAGTANTGGGGGGSNIGGSGIVIIRYLTP